MTGAPRAFRTLRGDGRSELEIKRSRFLGRALPLADEPAVRAALEATRLEHPEAGHHAFAYRLGQAGEIARFSDDGEPGGTAGRPGMEVLLREDIVGALVVVSRYWGGILLGAGGLTRAYGQAAAKAVRTAGIGTMLPYTEMEVVVDYSSYGALEQFLARSGLVALENTFADEVTVRIPIRSGEETVFSARIADLTAGMAVVTSGGTLYRPE